MNTNHLEDFLTYAETHNIEVSDIISIYTSKAIDYAMRENNSEIATAAHYDRSYEVLKAYAQRKL